MVMIGAHREKRSGKVWILLQNFWPGKNFRLVSAEYLASCGPTLCFLAIASVDLSLKGGHSVVDTEYAECDVHCEEYEQELVVMERYEY
jgi:hypothetical protein